MNYLRRKPSYDNFNSRSWRNGEETPAQFMHDLQHLAALLNIPDGLVKAQFINGIPSDVAAELRILDAPNKTCAEMCDIADRVMKFKPRPHLEFANVNNNIIESL